MSIFAQSRSIIDGGTSDVTRNNRSKLRKNIFTGRKEKSRGRADSLDCEIGFQVK